MQRAGFTFGLAFFSVLRGLFVSKSSSVGLVFADFFVALMVAVAITAVAYPAYWYLGGYSSKEKLLKLEIAENLFKMHGDCAGAKRWVKDFKCD